MLGVTSRSVREGSWQPFFFWLTVLLWEQDTTAGLEYSVYRFIHGDRQAPWWGIKGARKLLMPNEESFSKTRSVQFWTKRVTITSKSWLQRILTHKLSNFSFISLVRSCVSRLNFPKLSPSSPPGVAKLTVPRWTEGASYYKSTRQQLMTEPCQRNTYCTKVTDNTGALSSFYICIIYHIHMFYTINT